jgi:hypothetical protein
MKSIDRYYALRSKGLCGQCGRMPAVNGCRCEFCNDAHNERMRNRREPYRDGRPKYRVRKTRGLCVTCGVPISRYARCLRCRQGVAASVQKSRTIWKRKYDELYREGQCLTTR